MEPQMDIPALQAFVSREFPQLGDDFTIESLNDDGVTVRLHVADHHLRPGGTVSGPSMFALADVGMYLAILAQHVFCNWDGFWQLVTRCFIVKG